MNTEEMVRAVAESVAAEIADKPSPETRRKPCEHTNKQWVSRHHPDVSDPALYANGWWALVCVRCDRQFDYCADWLGAKGRCRCGQHRAAK